MLICNHQQQLVHFDEDSFHVLRYSFSIFHYLLTPPAFQLSTIFNSQYNESTTTEEYDSA